jgi:allophanate hydrolase subunit 1
MTFHANLSFETYETEETVSLELDQLPGVASVNVTQLDVTVQYDPRRISPDEILRTLRNNPEVRIKDDNSGQ